MRCVDDEQKPHERLALGAVLFLSAGCFGVTRRILADNLPILKAFCLTAYAFAQLFSILTAPSSHQRNKQEC